MRGLVPCSTRWRGVIVATALATGCAREAASVPRDAGGEPAIPLDAASLGPAAPLECGGVTCALPDAGDASRASDALGARACCLPGGGCGRTLDQVSTACLAGRGPGSVDPTCATATLPDGTRVAGCCTDQGRCGLYDRTGALGCVPRTLSDGGVTGASCRYAPDLECRRVVERVCDGPEDCQDGTRCCARAAGGELDAFACLASCSVRAATSAEPWLEICHLGGSCSALGELCVAAADLPPGSGRCVVARAGDGGLPDAGAAAIGVACGDSVCATGESCCLREPTPPYCAAPGDGCSCSGSGARD